MDAHLDLIEQGDDGDGPEHADNSGLVQAILAPQAMALASMVLAAVSLFGLGLMNGTAYLPMLFSSGPPERSMLVAALLLGVVLTLMPTALGALALRRIPEDGPWRAVAGAGVLLGLLAFVLRLAVMVMTALDDAAQYSTL